MSNTAMQEKTTRYETGTLSYAISGDENKHTLCFIPGWGGNRHLLYEVAQSFSTDYQVIVAEFPGFRDSLLSSPYTIEHVTNALQHILSEENVENVTLLGHSMGGAIALSYATEHPSNVSQVIGIDCFTYSTIYPKQPVEAVAGFIAAIKPDFKAGLAPVIEMSCNEHTSDASKAAIIETFHSADPTIGTALLKECLEWDMLAKLDQYKGSVSAIVAAPSYDEQSFRASCPDHIDIHCVENSAHYIALDQPLRLIKEISKKLG